MRKKRVSETVRVLIDCCNFREISIMLDAEEAGSVELDVSYVVWNAFWSPSYDLRVSTDEKTMKVRFTISQIFEHVYSYVVNSRLLITVSSNKIRTKIGMTHVYHWALQCRELVAKYLNFAHWKLDSSLHRRHRRLNFSESFSYASAKLKS